MGLSKELVRIGYLEGSRGLKILGRPEKGYGLMGEAGIGDADTS
jgi:hypothetical protein